jgi:flagellar hook-basal body complex protein FliE
MSLQSLQGQTPFIQIGNASSPGLTPKATEAKSDLPFADLVKSMVQQTNAQQVSTKDSVEQLITGETDSIHDVVLTASRADMAFRLMMEIRNRLIASYQEVMRMQV